MSDLAKAAQQARKKSRRLLLPKACDGCPWRKNAAPGWLGPHSAERWVEIAHSDSVIACHKHIAEGGEWDGAQCRGAADYRANVFKDPRDPDVLTGERNERIFASPMAFMAHHNREGADDAE